MWMRRLNTAAMAVQSLDNAQCVFLRRRETFLPHASFRDAPVASPPEASSSRLRNLITVLYWESVTAPSVVPTRSHSAARVRTFLYATSASL